MMMMIMVIKMIIAGTQSILKLGPPDFAWKYIFLLGTEDLWGGLSYYY